MNATSCTRIAMWSGPRNISTAMMRSWGSRADTAVCDEPLYAHYLRHSGAAHPGAAEVLAAQDTDWRRVVDQLIGPAPGDKAIYYQKHMSHHMVEDIELDWLDRLQHAFLIRQPELVIDSLRKVLPSPTLPDTGFPQQLRLYQHVCGFSDSPPPVLDAADVLKDPRGALTRLCAALEVPFDETMLRWEAGPRPGDGVWAKHWYRNVENSTGFAPYRPRAVEIPDRLRPLLEACRPYYNQLQRRRLVPGVSKERASREGQRPE